MPHGHCYLWSPGLVWLHVIGDSLIVLAYYSIPVTLLYFVRKRSEVNFGWMLLCFAGFILACGTTHLLEIWNIWHSAYWLSGATKALTGVFSALTAVRLVGLMPKALSLQSPAALARANAELQEEIRNRRNAEDRAHQLNMSLEARVAERTAELNEANSHLEAEVLERNQTEIQLRASLKEVNDLKAALDEHAIVAFTDPQGRITYVNDKFCAISKYSREELIGRDHRIINSGYHPAEFFRNLWDTIALGRVWHGEIKNRAKDGSYYWVDTTIVPFLGEDGKPRQYVAIRADVTERKQATEALLEKEEQFHTMVDAIPQLAWMADSEGSLFWYNQRWFDYTGTTFEQMAGWGWQSVHDPEMLPRVVENWSASIAAGKPFEMSFPLRGADGQFRWFLTAAFPLKDSSGRVQRWCGTNTDINKMREAEEEIQRLNTDLERRVVERTTELENANKELEAFSYSVSHDLRAPLRAVDGFSQAVIEEFGAQLPESGRRLLGVIREAAQKMGTLIDDLLSFSRLSRVPLKKQRVNMESLVREVLEETAPERKGREIKVRIEELPSSIGDPALLKQVWVNLLSNAIKYTRNRSDAVVEIGCSQMKGESVYFVRDNGTGFDMQYADKLFGVFQRLHRDEDYEGTGVGLALVQRIVHRHGGRIWAEAALERGATFYFTLQHHQPL